MGIQKRGIVGFIFVNSGTNLNHEKTLADPRCLGKHGNCCEETAAGFTLISPNYLMPKNSFVLAF